MVTLNPIPRALVPVDSTAAQRLCSPNYDEFQSDLEIFELLQRQPDSVLRITMPHACADSPEAMLREGSPEALQAASSRMAELLASPLTREVRDALFLYEISDPSRPGTRQIGLGGLAPTGDILTEATPQGTIVRNEGVRPKKARGRADLIEATRSFIGGVNNAVEDTDGRLSKLLATTADGRPADYEALAEDGCTHRIWTLAAGHQRTSLLEALAAEPFAYVADGNHRSAAAAMLDLDGFLAIAFPASSMGLAPYNRLVEVNQQSAASWREALSRHFRVDQPPSSPDYQPTEPHSIGLYTGQEWLRLTPRSGAYDADNAAESIDAAIVQKRVFDELCGISDPRDERLTFVGGNRDATYLRERVDSGEHTFAVTLSPVTIGQFVEVCRQRRMMPPKSTWFSPKIRSGLVMALLD
ncbi:MAG: DUF1015 domain-containing protein [Acidobacteriia bacterium]|nr:DUF1015 domain-containing protein [Terriglobia bacterium]MYG02619.1 DUF1015 domain-containing protein [Terriglobia bacterium]MYK09787.1 DUF1015 domain-containing protein [Terriglobia bacterium]